MSQYTGRVVVSIGGQRLRSKEGASLNMGGITRAPALSDSGVDGFVEAYTQPEVEFAINHNGQVSLAQLHATTNATLIFETDTGQIFTLRQAWCAEPPRMTKGEVSLKFAGVECIEG